MTKFFHFQIKTCNFQLIFNRNQLFGLAQGQSVKSSQICQHLVCDIQLAKCLAGTDRTKDIVEKMWIDLGLQKLIFQSFFINRETDNGFQILCNGMLHIFKSNPKSVNFIISGNIIWMR